MVVLVIYLDPNFIHLLLIPLIFKIDHINSQCHKYAFPNLHLNLNRLDPKCLLNYFRSHLSQSKSPYLHH